MSLRESTVQWATLSGIRAGLGICRLFRPATLEELRECLPFHPTILGNGSNFIGTDAPGLCGAKLSPDGEFGTLHFDGQRVTAGAAIGLNALLSQVAQRGLGGYAELSGIPGTLGGALRMNAGALGKAIGAAVRKLVGIQKDTGTIWERDCLPQDWGYRNSPIPPDVILTAALLEFSPVLPETELATIRNELARRRQVTPPGASCGSVFRNPAPDTPAGKLLEQAGCKGMTRGNFSVSTVHANWIVNLSRQPDAAANCLALLQECRQRVLAQTGILLQPEWQIHSY